MQGKTGSGTALHTGSAYGAVVENSSTSVLQYPQKADNLMRRIMGLGYGNHFIVLNISKNGLKFRIGELGKTES